MGEEEEEGKEGKEGKEKLLVSRDTSQLPPVMFWRCSVTHNDQDRKHVRGNYNIHTGNFFCFWFDILLSENVHLSKITTLSNTEPFWVIWRIS